MKKWKIVKQFSDTREMTEWLADPRNIEQLQKDCPNTEGELDLINFCIKVTED